jgi:hypothetical protein
MSVSLNILPVVFVILKGTFVFVFLNNFVIVRMYFPVYVNATHFRLSFMSLSRLSLCSLYHKHKQF